MAENNLCQLNSEGEINDFISHIVNAQQNLSLVCVIGAGTSISQGYPDWNHYVIQLIDYWKFHLQDLVNQKETFHDKVRIQDIQFLEWLRESNLGVKRKVDLVDFLIEQYSQVKDEYESKAQMIYAQAVNACERFVFLETEPVQSQNAVLDQLVKLKTTFITTNYDQQIEASYKRELRLKPVVFSDISMINNSFSMDTILHLHGMPQEGNKLFVSSSESYKELYLDIADHYRQQFRNFFEGKRKLLLLFIGCSMEEEEVLSLLDFPEMESEMYALMRYDSSGTDEACQSRNKRIEEFYLKKKNVHFIWFGEKFSDLPVFVETIVNRVMDDVNPKPIQPDALQSMVLNEQNSDMLIKINKVLKNNNYYIIESIFKGIAKESHTKQIQTLAFLLKSDLVKKGILKKSHNFPIGWKLLEKNYLQLNQSEQLIIAKLIRHIEAWNQETLNHIVSIGIKYVDLHSTSKGTRAKMLKQCLSRILKSDFFAYEIKDQQLRCLWLLEQLQNNQFTSEGIDKDVMFDFDISTYRRFINIMKKLANTKIYYSFKGLIDFTVVNGLSKLIEANRLTYNGNEAFPIKFYENVIIQKILINLDLENKLSNQNLKRLIQSIDYNQKFMGSEMNEFVKKNKILKAKENGYYIDGITEPIARPIIDKAVIPVLNLSSTAHVDALISKLIELTEQSKIDKHDPFIEYNISGQNKELLTKLNTKAGWDTHAEKYSYFLNKIISSDKLLKRHREVVSKMLCMGLKCKSISTDLPMDYIKQIRKNGMDIFDYTDADLLEEYVACEHTNIHSEIFNFLFITIKPKELPTKSRLVDPGHKDSYIRLEEFMNSSIGAYYEIIQIIEEKYQNIFNFYANNFLQGLESLSLSIREYLKGRFFESVPSDDLERKSLQAFIGYSHRYRIIKSDAEYYKEAVSKLLKSEINERVVVANCAAVLTVALSPSDGLMKDFEFDKSNNDLVDQIGPVLVDWFLNETEVKDDYLSEWLSYYLKQKPETVQIIVQRLVSKLNKGKSRQIRQVITLIEKNSSSEAKYVKERQFAVVRLEKLNQDQLKLLVKLIIVLLRKELIIIGPSFLGQLENIIHELVARSMDAPQTKLLETIRKFISKSDYEHLKDIR